MPIDMLKLRTMISLDEGLRLKPYKDTVGRTTIGFGRNLDDVGISQDEALYMLTNDLTRLCARINLLAPWFQDVDDTRKLAILDMAYNLGLAGLLTFKDMIAAIQAKDWQAASQAMLASKWATQVGARAGRLAKVLLTGQDSI